MAHRIAFVLLFLAAGAFAQGAAFNIDVRAPKGMREVIENNIEQRRYREVTDLDDAELARLITAAERNVRELVATQGYFNPQIAVRREDAGGHPVIVIDVQPGPLTYVEGTKIAFEGAIAGSV